MMRIADASAGDAFAGGQARMRGLALLPLIAALLSIALVALFSVLSWRTMDRELRRDLDAADRHISHVIELNLGHLVMHLAVMAGDPDLPRSTQNAFRMAHQSFGMSSITTGLFDAAAFTADTGLDDPFAALPAAARRALLGDALRISAPVLSRPYGDPQNRSLMIVVPPAEAGRMLAVGVFQLSDIASVFREALLPPGAAVKLLRYTDGAGAVLLRMRQPLDPDASAYVAPRPGAKAPPEDQVTWRGLAGFDLALATALDTGARTAIWRQRNGAEFLFLAFAGLFATGAAVGVARILNAANARKAGATAELAARERRPSVLVQENARLAAAVEASPLAVMISDPNHPGNPIVYVNDAFTTLTGYGRDEALGARPDILNGDETDPAAIAMLREAARQGQTATVELLNRHKDGGYWWNQVSVSPLHGEDGAIEALVYVKSDLTDHKRYEDELRAAKEVAERANTAKSKFIAVTGHELRSPLNAIMGFSEMLREETLGPLGVAAYRDYAVDIHAGASHLLALVNDLLDLSMIESGHMTLDRDSVDLNDAIAGALVLVRQRALADAVTLETALDEGLPPICGDARRVKQIALNLLTNAVKFTAAGGTVRISSRREQDVAVFTVADTGVGIAEDDIEKVLQPYGQARNRLAGREHGTGLGLPLTKDLVALHGGTLAIRSVVGEGTTVTVRLPLEA